MRIHRIIELHRSDIEAICAKHNLMLEEEVMQQRRNKWIQKGRTECYAYLRNIGYRYQDIADAFNLKSHSAIIYSLKKHCPYRDKIKNVN